MLGYLVKQDWLGWRESLNTNEEKSEWMNEWMDGWNVVCGMFSWGWISRCGIDGWGGVVWCGVVCCMYVCMYVCGVVLWWEWWANKDGWTWYLRTYLSSVILPLTEETNRMIVQPLFWPKVIDGVIVICIWVWAWIGLDWIGLDWTGLDGIGLDSTQFDSIRLHGCLMSFPVLQSI